MILGITVFSPSLVLLTPKHQCLLEYSVTMSRPSEHQDRACHLLRKSEIKVSYQPLHFVPYINEIFIQDGASELVVCPNGWEYNTTGLFHTAVEDVRMLTVFVSNRPNELLYRVV